MSARGGQGGGSMTKARFKAWFKERNTCLDYIIFGGIVLIGLAEAAHLGAVVLGWSFTRCAWLLGGIAGLCLICVPGFLLYRHGRAGRNREPGDKGRTAGSPGLDGPECVLAAIFAAVAASQLFLICGWDGVFRQGDMMAETVGSFLVSDGIYRVNPMTGAPYTEGIPSRLKVLCLPTLYGSLCKLTGLSPRTVVWRIVPAVTLLASYVSFASLGRCLFGEGDVEAPQANTGGIPVEGAPSGTGRKRWDRKKQWCFMAAVSVLIWAGSYAYGMDGFDLLYCGYRGEVIRNMVLMPWLFSLCLRGKWILAFLCILAEACMVWTFYGMGACLFVTVGMALIRLALKTVSGRLK